MYPYIQIFGHSFGTYGVIAAFAALLCGILFICSLKRMGGMMEDGILLLICVLIGVMLGGHLLYALTQYRYIPYLFERVELSLWLARAQYIFGGSVFYGGLLGGIGCGYAGGRILKLNISLCADLMTPIIPLFHGFARIGCFFAGCCYGIPCSIGFAAVENTIVPEVNAVTRFPVQLLEATLNFALAGMLWCFLRLSYRKAWLQGNLIKLYLLFYGGFRFLLEFLRGDAQRGFWGMLSTSQWISIALICIGMILLGKDIIIKRKERFLYRELQ